MALRLFIILGLLAQQMLILPCVGATRLGLTSACGTATDTDDATCGCCPSGTESATCGCTITPDPLPQPQPLSFHLDLTTLLALPAAWVNLPTPATIGVDAAPLERPDHLVKTAQERCAILCCWIK